MSNLDVLILGLFLLVSFGIGAWSSRRTKTVADYLLGGHQLPGWLLLGSIVATETSVVTFLSIPGTAARAGGNLTFLQLAFGFALGRVLVAIFMVPAIFRGRRFSVYELVGERFGRGVQRLSSLTFLLMRTVSDGLRLYLAALVLQAALGWRLDLCILAFGVVTIGYTWLGGFRAVVLNDCFQLLIYLVAGIASFIILIDRLGWQTIDQFAETQQKWTWLDLRFSLTEPYVLMAGLVGGCFLSLATHGADQMMAQRYLAARNRTSAAWAVGLSGVIVAFQFAFFLVLGVALGCWHEVITPSVELIPDQLFARFMVAELPPGLLGVALAGVFAAAMSTLSSSLNSSATSWLADWRGSGGSHDLETEAEGWGHRSRFASAAFGGLQILVGLSAGWLLPWLSGSPATQSPVIGSVLKVASYATGLLLGLLFLAMSSRCRSSTAATVAFLTGFAGMTLIAFGTPLAWPWYALVGSTLVVATGILIERVITSRNPSSTSPAPPASR